MFLDCVDGRRGRLTQDEELLGWERGCLSLGDLPELASWYGGSHVELWWRYMTSRQMCARHADCGWIGDVRKTEGEGGTLQSGW